MWAMTEAERVRWHATMRRLRASTNPEDRVTAALMDHGGGFGENEDVVRPRARQLLDELLAQERAATVRWLREQAKQAGNAAAETRDLGASGAASAYTRVADTIERGDHVNEKKGSTP